MGQILKTITWLHNEWLILRYNFSVFNQFEKSFISDISFEFKKWKDEFKEIFPTSHECRHE